MSNHLSELCKGTEVGPIEESLRRIFPSALSADDNDGTNSTNNNDNEVNHDNEEEGGVDKKSSSDETSGTHAQMRRVFRSIWSHRDGDGRTALHWAVAVRNFPLAQTLLRGPHFALACSEDTEGVSPFATACMVGAPESFLAELLAASAEQRMWKLAQEKNENENENEKKNGDGAPEALTSTGNEAVTDSIDLHKVAIADQPDSHGNTPLLYAAGRGNLALVRYLLQLGASIDHQNKRGQSALHRAANRGSLDLVEELIASSKKKHNSAEHRRWMNLQDYRGDTALFYASMDNNEELGRYLLRHGADRDIRNKDGKEFWEV
ncbi:26S proteasome non-ATPase regulatory subunit 10 [Trypanosoma theileri]|uniref:26S proteasome non-ATPase regulatory subunit 10 n=1 Tax=Trypanosoma theileri TaxID=67003 RepID=A0A1X0P783_9TRYP|nr:26S proteasome non-ATPase regulatory subunit 10 [Trypanosoma theileri]ORC92705.1 26S proteasome non-ATPase regulatory subunit 10 [Trypanosoma theileri]